MNLYSSSVPVFKKALKNLHHIVEKTEAFVEEKNLKEDRILNAFLAVDMLPFARQVQIACDNAKGATTRLAGKATPQHADEESSLHELKERIEKTLAVLEELQPEDFEGGDQRAIEIVYFPGKTISGIDYLVEYALPNFFFHVVTAYDILRHHGVQIGKADFLGTLSLKSLS